MLEDVKKHLSLDMYKEGVIGFREEGYTFNLHVDHPDAPKSPNYVNARNYVRNPSKRDILAGLIIPFVQRIGPNKLIDLPEAITPLVSTISDRTGIPIVSIRSEALKGKVKDHGADKGKIFTGKIKEGDVGLMLDDVVSSFAHTKFRAIPLIRQIGLILAPFVCVIIDREEGGREMLAREGLELRSLLGLHSDITRNCHEAGFISDKIVSMSKIFADAARGYALAA